MTAPLTLDVTLDPAATGRLAAVCTVAQLFPVAESGLMSGIDKRPADGPVRLLTHGVLGDAQGRREHHGGIYEALYAFPRERREEVGTASWRERGACADAV